MKSPILAVLGTLLLVAGCAKAPPPAPSIAVANPKPGLWAIADTDTTIYLFGTIHVLPKEFAWRTPAINAAIKRSDELVIEVSEMDDPNKTAALFSKIAISPGLPVVAERLPEEKRPAFAALATKSGIPADFLDSLETWAVAITLATGMLVELGLSPEYGVEEQLETVFTKAKKPISGLETSEFQLGLFDDLPEAVQRTFLVGMVDESANAKKEFEDMVSAWARGDDKAIALTFDDELMLSPELTDKLLRQRNENWTQWLVKRLERPGTVFLAVGAGHLAGDVAVQSMLAKRGVAVKRLQ